MNRVRLLDEIRGRLLQGALVLAACAYSFHVVSFSDAKTAVFALGLVLVGGAVACRRRFCWEGVQAFWPLWTLLAFQAVVHVGAAQSAVPADTFTAIARAGLALLIGAAAFDLLHEERWRRGMQDALLLSAVLVSALALLQYARLIPGMFPEFPEYDQRMYSVFGNQDLLGGYAALGLTLALVRTVRRLRPSAVELLTLGVLVPALVLSGSRSAWLAATVGAVIVVWPTAKTAGRRGAFACVVVAVLLGGLVAAYAPGQTVGRVAGTFSENDVGGRVRLWIWHGGARMTADHPVLGRGLGVFSYWSPPYMGQALREAPDFHYYNELHAAHAHCDLLEWAALTGLAGLLLLGAMALRLSRCRGEEWAGLAALLTFSFFNAAFASPPHAVAGILLAAALLARRGAGAPGRASWAAARVIPAAGLCVAGFLAWADVWPSMLLRTAETAHLAGDAETLAAYERVMRHPWPNYAGRQSHGIALEEHGLREEAYHSLLAAREGLNTGEIHLALALVAQRMGRLDEARAWADACIWRWPKNTHAWAVRVQTSVDVGDCVKQRAAAGRWLSGEGVAALPTCADVTEAAPPQASQTPAPGRP